VKLLFSPHPKHQPSAGGHNPVTFFEDLFLQCGPLRHVMRRVELVASGLEADIAHPPDIGRC